MCVCVCVLLWVAFRGIYVVEHVIEGGCIAM